MILVVDDEASQLELIQRILAKNGHRIVTATNVAEAVPALDRQAIDVLITDMRMPGAGGLELVRYVHDNAPDIGVIAITGYPTLAAAVEATKLGAEDYLPKPFAVADLVGAVDRCLARSGPGRDSHNEATAGSRLDGVQWGVKGESPPMLEVFQMIRRVAPSDVSVLLQGETGTGKELVARAIHQESRRASGPFKEINCAAVPDELLESELFGHVKGAYTGADRTRKGLFVAADGGTVFLDEIGDMSSRMQAALLRVLEERRVKPVGTTRDRRIDVRLVTATNSDLAEAMNAGRFREELYYRIHAVRIELPPLRVRGNDIDLLALHFLSVFAKQHGRPPPHFTDAARDALHRYAWPGNVRELRHVVEQLVLMCERDVIDVRNLHKEVGDPAPARVAHQTLKEVQETHIERVLEEVNGNRTEAAKILDVPERTLRRWLNEKKDDKR